MNQNKIHFVYLIPQDKPDLASSAIRRAALHMQSWCQWQMGNKKTFTPVFAIYTTKHPEMWYSTYTSDPNTPHSEWYWGNALTDARDYAGAQFYMEHDSWVIYLDALIAPDQHAGGASVNGSGICVLHSKDCAAIRGADKDWTLCRAVGGGLHETLHTLGLPHPPPGPEFGRALMGTGYMTYPDCILTDNDKVALDNSRFFAPSPVVTSPTICPFKKRPVAPPRPHPLPVVRPR